MAPTRKKDRVFHNIIEIGELPEESTDVYQWNMLNKCLDSTSIFFKKTVVNIVSLI